MLWLFIGDKSIDTCCLLSHSFYLASILVCSMNSLFIFIGLSSIPLLYVWQKGRRMIQFFLFLFSWVILILMLDRYRYFNLKLSILFYSIIYLLCFAINSTLSLTYLCTLLIKRVRSTFYLFLLLSLYRVILKCGILRMMGASLLRRSTILA